MPHLLDAEYALDSSGIHLRRDPVHHREDRYDPRGFQVLRGIQERHFWYAGRHRFLLGALRDVLGSEHGLPGAPRGVDLGGGCGGWIQYLGKRMPGRFGELALADSSRVALDLAGPVVGPGVGRYQVDLLDLRWRDRWDVAFLLDVLQLIPEDLDALGQIRQSLRPGGLLFVTASALRFFWSEYDEANHLARRYSKADLRGLAERSGMDLLQSRYYMFFLSPLFLVSRLRQKLSRLDAAERVVELKRAHEVPAAPLNLLLRLAFAAETPLGLRLPFPWGTSILGVLRRPA